MNEKRRDPMKRKALKNEVLIGAYIEPQLKKSVIKVVDKKRITLSQFFREAIIEKLEKENGSKEVA